MALTPGMGPPRSVSPAPKNPPKRDRLHRQIPDHCRCEKGDDERSLENYIECQTDEAFDQRSEGSHGS
jgi:hypothetical protein